MSPLMFIASKHLYLEVFATDIILHRAGSLVVCKITEGQVKLPKVSSFQMRKSIYCFSSFFISFFLLFLQHIVLGVSLHGEELLFRKGANSSSSYMTIKVTMGLMVSLEKSLILLSMDEP